MNQNKVFLSRKKYSIIDESMAPIISKYKWSAYKSNNGKRWYAVTRMVVGGNKKIVTMHRFLMNFPKGKEIDHINMDGLDNRLKNLRVCNKSQNMANRKKRNNTASVFKGVTFRKDTKKWVSQITKNNRHYRIGEYLSELEAAKAYDVFAKKHHGEFAVTNFK